MLYFGLQDGSIVESDINGNFSNYVAHSEPITCLSYGKYLYSCSHDGLIKYWDNGFLVRELQGHNGHITALVYTGTKLYSGGADKTINEWDPETGRRKWILTGSRGWIMCLASSPSLPSRLFSADTDHTIRIWDTSSGRCLHELKGHKDWIYSLCLNDQFLYSSSKDGTIRVWYCQDFSLISVLEGPDKQPITQVTVSSNKLFSCSENGSLYCWNLENQIPIVILGKEGNVSCLSSFGQWLVVGSLDGSIKLLDMGPSGIETNNSTNTSHTLSSVVF
ncbi:WD40-repeat-containing domain protein [Gorgonomyces haynaldii]|nr:WD40-repeat-containing domain protein [Gorgonomyces haynaldii]